MPSGGYFHTNFFFSNIVSMAESECPSVHVVDSYANWPPVPLKLSHGRRRAGVAQNLLFLLVSVALGGIAGEAYFIYRLYQPGSGPSASSSKLSAGEDVTLLSKRPSDGPSKPVAHLTDGQDVTHRNKIMAWSMDADPLLFKMDYKDGGLLIQKDGFYYVYSKISFSVTGVFHHSVELKTKLYMGQNVPLLKSRKYSTDSSEIRTSSYLGGVFHLIKDDTLFVKVSNTSNVLRYKSFENVFGAFML